MINKIKIMLDILMTILMVLLMKLNFLGLQFHEIIGITIFILFVIHKVLNFKFIKTISKNFLNPKIKIKSKIMLILDIVLLFFMIANIMTGLLISKYILNGLITIDTEYITVLHKFFAWWTLIIISIHIGMHLDRLIMSLNRKFKFLKNNIIRIIVLIIYLAFAVLGIKSICKYSIYSKLLIINNNQSEIIQKENDIIDKHDIENTSKNEEQKQDSNIPSLEEYLSQFHCDGCKKSCSLLNPKCAIGKSKREEKIKEYYKIYGNKEENNDSNDNSNNNEINNNNPTPPTIENNSNEKCKNKSNIFDIVNIIILFMGGTYYINELLKKRKVKSK